MHTLASAAAVVAGPPDLALLHARELPQKDFLCGCFWASLVLRAAGGSDSLDQDLVALEAGTILPNEDVASVPPGETKRRDYRVELPHGPLAIAGTAAPALAAAIERLSRRGLSVVPVSGPWSGDRVAGLVETVATVAPETSLLANVRTGPLWGSRAHPSLLLDHLGGREAEPPPADWDTGHFVNVAALVRGRARAALVVRDSYRSLGFDGHHLQPTDAFARALERGDASEGGVLCVAPPRDVERLRARLESADYELRHWDNGTPYGI